jgi:bacterioferritin (cytochrome b1)
MCNLNNEINILKEQNEKLKVEVEALNQYKSHYELQYKLRHGEEK